MQQLNVKQKPHSEGKAESEKMIFGFVNENIEDSLKNIETLLAQKIDEKENQKASISLDDIQIKGVVK